MKLQPLHKFILLAPCLIFSGVTLNATATHVAPDIRSDAPGEQGVHNIRPAPDGGYFLAGTSPSDKGDRDIAVWKLDARLRPDPGFGRDGLVTLGSTGDDQAVDVVVTAKGTLLVLAQAGAGDRNFKNFNHAGGMDLALLRLDPTTGRLVSPENGRAPIQLMGGGDDDEFIVHLDNFSEPGSRWAETGEGGLIVAAMTRSHDGPWGSGVDAGSSHGRDILIFKLTADGNVDTRFAGDGFFRLGVEPGIQKKQQSGHDFVFSVVRHPDIGYLFSGYTVGSNLILSDGQVIPTRGNQDHQGKNSASRDDIFDYKMDGLLFALDEGGRLVESFGDRGVVFYGGTRQEKIYDVLVRPDGSILTAGRTSSRDLDIERQPREWGQFDAAVFQFTPKGRLDPSFGKMGVALMATNGDDQALRLAGDDSRHIRVLLHSDSHHYPFTTPTRPSRYHDGFILELDAKGKITTRIAVSNTGDIKPTGLLTLPGERLVVSGIVTREGNKREDRNLFVNHLKSETFNPTPRYREIQRFSAPEARQGVAVDDRNIYAISNSMIAIYDKRTHRLIDRWKEPEGDTLIHLNAGIVKNGRLWTAHSNYPEVPMLSSIEIWEIPRLKHERNHSFGARLGSLTWVDRHQGSWYACFAHYGNRAAEPNRDPSWTQFVRLDENLSPVEGWVFPAALVEKFGRYSSSGGAFGPDGRLYITGHDHAELYVLEIPQKGSILEWVDLIPIPSEGQAFAFDPHHPGRIYSILRRTREIIIGEIRMDDINRLK